MDTKYKARLNAIYFILAGAATLSLGGVRSLADLTGSGQALLLISLTLLLTGVYNIYFVHKPSRLLPYILMLLLGAYTLTEHWAAAVMSAHWAYILPLYLFSLLPFSRALPLVLGYALLFNFATMIHLTGAERLQILYLFWSATTIACIFMFTNRERQKHLQRLVSMDADCAAYNQQQFLEDLPRELARADRENTSLTLLCMQPRRETKDLMKLSLRISQVLRPFDRLYRINDYLIAILPTASFQDSINLSYQTYNRFDREMHLAAVIPGEHDTEAELIRKADHAIQFAASQAPGAPLYLQSDLIDIQNEQASHA